MRTKKNAPGNVALPAGSMPTDLALRLVSETGAVEGGEDGIGAAENLTWRADSSRHSVQRTSAGPVNVSTPKHILEKDRCRNTSIA
jgi:hypothetical protein